MHLKAALARLFMLACVLPSSAHSSPLVEIHTDHPHGPNNRGAWRDGFDIYSDYTNNSVVPPGKLVEYDFVISQKIISPDGYDKLGMVVNGQYPGPTLLADWGDTIRITVYNNFTDNYNGTSIHWHGIRQYQTNWLDGVPGVTQCPSKPGESQVYEFRAMQYGTSWYHGHFSLQYSNGLYGAIVVKGPSSANYDIDLGPWFLTDWYHEDVFSLQWIGETTHRAAIPETTLLNGKGIFECNATDTRCTGTGGLHETVVVKNKRYKIGVINSSTLLTYTFSIDGHNLTIIATDFVPIEPYTVEVINVGIGQRYEFIIETNADLSNGPNFWINAHYCDLAEILPSQIGVIRYDATNRSDPYTPEPRFNEHGCADPHPSNLVPVVKKNVGSSINGLDPKDYLTVGHQAWPNASDFPGHIRKWIIKNEPMWLDWKDPTLKKLNLDEDPSFPPETVPVILDYETNEWVYFLITSNYSMDIVDAPRNLTPSVHPMHLHGHDFAILAQGDGIFPPETVPNLINPPRRDVVDINIGGWAWIAFQIENPGAWLFHCHLAFHASAGFALQFIEQPSKIKQLFNKAGIADDFSQRCDGWASWYDSVNVAANATQADSGI